MHIATTAPIATSDAPPELAAAILAEAMEEPAHPTRTQKVVYDELVAADRNYRRVSRRANAAREHYRASSEATRAAADAAEKAYPVEPWQVVARPTDEKVITGGRIDYSDGAVQHIEATSTMLEVREPYQAKSIFAGDGDKLRRFDAWRTASLAAGEAGRGPEHAKIKAEFERAVKPQSAAMTRKGELFAELLSIPATSLQEVLRVKDALRVHATPAHGVEEFDLSRVYKRITTDLSSLATADAELVAQGWEALRLLAIYGEAEA